MKKCYLSQIQKRNKCVVFYWHQFYKKNSCLEYKLRRQTEQKLMIFGDNGSISENK